MFLYVDTIKVIKVIQGYETLEIPQPFNLVSNEIYPI